MGIPVDAKEKRTQSTSTEPITLPVYKLSNTPVVLLPGILYKINFNQTDALNLLNFYKKNKRVNNLLISNVQIPEVKDEKDEDDYDEVDEPQIISEESLMGSRTFRRFVNGENGDENAYDWLIIGMLPTSGDKIVTVSRIVGISNDDKDNIILTFQALTRGEINWTSEKKIRFKNNLRELPLTIYTNAVELSESYLKAEIDSFNTLTTELFRKIDMFLHDFLIASTIDKTKVTNQDKRYALTLSPLANALNVQFSNDYKSSAPKLKRLIERFNSSFDEYGPKRNSEQFLKIIDLLIAVLPIEKYEFLSKIVIEERLQYFKHLVLDFNMIFKNLYDSIDYVEKFYSQATDLEKSKIISNQLKAIRFSLDAIKSNRSSPGGPGPKSGGGGSQQGDEQNDELQLVSKFMNNLPFDLNEDGVKLLFKDFNRLKKMPQQHSEYQVLRTYFDIILDIPFGQYISFDKIDIAKVSKHLNDDHYGLYHVKKRLLQYLSVLKLHEINELDKANNSSSNVNAPTVSSHSDDQLIIGNYQEDFLNKQVPSPGKKISKPMKTSIKSPILLFVGPPGVGKTSLAKSIADSLGRKFQRVSLGGIRDESEIRGHRRTYVGSLPGVIINALRKAGSMNPLILLDEIDKVCGGSNTAGRVNGDPEAALLEVLDPEQNWSFTDHYIGFPVDLSNVLFLCTANELGAISAPLRDRMEVIEISGYTFEEKLEIGSRFLLPKQIKQNGLPDDSVVIKHNIWEKLIQEYIREAGVRNLERKIAAICRGKAVEYVECNNNPDHTTAFVKTVEPNKLVKYLGLPNHPITKDILSAPKYSNPQGVVNGLSYNSDGSGSVLVFEVISIPSFNSKGESNSPKLIMTGRLGETLTESIKIGLTFIKSIISRDLITDVDSREVLRKFNNSELHLHVPMGSIPKDGPSAGITITLALLSIALSKPVPGYIAMTGEITLRGKVLPIGGIGEKLLGASQNNIKKVLIPKLNRKDIIETFYNDDEDKLIGFLKDGVVINGCGEPEKKVKDKLGIDIVYVDTFFDVIKAVWGDEVNIGGHLIENRL